MLAVLGSLALAGFARASSEVRFDSVTLTNAKANEVNLGSTTLVLNGSYGVVNMSGGTLSNNGWATLVNDPSIPVFTPFLPPTLVGTSIGGTLIPGSSGGMINLGSSDSTGTLFGNGSSGLINVNNPIVIPTGGNDPLNNGVVNVPATNSNPITFVTSSPPIVAPTGHLRDPLHGTRIIASLDSTTTLFAPVKGSPNAAKATVKAPVAGTVGKIGTLPPPTTLPPNPAMLVLPTATPPPIESGSTDAGLVKTGPRTTPIDVGPFGGTLVVTGGGTLNVGGPSTFNLGGEFQIGNDYGGSIYLGNGGLLHLAGGGGTVTGGTLNLTNGSVILVPADSNRGVVPEPGSVALLACGAFGLLARRRA
jgi:hypothetical protein